MHIIDMSLGGLHSERHGLHSNSSAPLVAVTSTVAVPCRAGQRHMHTVHMVVMYLSASFWHLYALRAFLK
jgi:hypothetical protein